MGAVKHLTKQKTAFITKNYLIKTVNSAEAQKLI